MKNKTASTFVLNVGEKYHFFVEGKNKSRYGVTYDVYYTPNNKPITYTANNFVETYGTNEKIAVVKFITEALINLTTLQGTDRKITIAQDTLTKLQNKLQNDNLKNPKLNKQDKNDLVLAIDTYNEIVDIIKPEPYFAYEDDYQLVTERKQVKVVEQAQTDYQEQSVRKTVTEIRNTTKEKAPKQRVLKYE